MIEKPPYLQMECMFSVFILLELLAVISIPLPAFGEFFFLSLSEYYTLLPDIQLLPLACPSEFHLLHHLCKYRNVFRNHLQTSSPLPLFTSYTISSLLRRLSTFLSPAQILPLSFRHIYNGLLDNCLHCLKSTKKPMCIKVNL